LDDGVDARQAFREAIGEFREIEDQLKKYLDAAALDSFVFKNPSDIGNENISVRRLDIAETNAELGTVEVWLRENAAARERLEKAMKADSRSALAVESMGVLNFNEGADRAALTFFEQALQRDSNRPLSGYFRGMLTTAPSPALLDVIKRNPDFAPAHVQLASAYLREGSTDLALTPAVKAAQLRPSMGGYHVLVGNILHALGRDSEAAAVARFVAERWRDVHRDEAVELWLKLPASVKQGVELSKRSSIPGTRVVSGKVTSLQCRDKNQTMRLVIDSTPLTLRVKDDKAGFGLSDTVWYGPDHFNRCQHLEGLRVAVPYRNGELIQLDVMAP
jgi:tetratricopeptide (TPR) repeat protein